MLIEKVTVSDAEELLGIYGPYVENTAISFEVQVPSVSEFAERIKRISAKYPYIKAVEDGEIIGYAYVGEFKGRRAYDWSVETTIYVRWDRRKNGVGRVLYEALEESAKRMGILNMNACIASPEEADEHLTRESLIFHEKLGYKMVGTFHNSGYKFNTWYDAVWMEKLIGEHTLDVRPVDFGNWSIG